MANKTLFKSLRGALAPKTDTVNEAGGNAYALSAQAALVQIAVTGCLNQTFYASAEDQLEALMNRAAQVDDTFLAQVAIYAREHGFMKDTPALLCAILAGRNSAMLAEIFPRVINSGKMLRNFVQIMRSGVTGRKSLGSAPKRLVQNWLNTASERALLSASVGQSPSLADVVKMVHPKPPDASRTAFFAWLIGKEFVAGDLPQAVQEFEAWKADRSLPLPKVPFQMLTAQELGQAEWTQIATNASWQMTRMNLNTFARHGVFEVPGMTERIAERLADPQEVERARAFPYQLMAAFVNASEQVPSHVKNALQTAMEFALANVPAITRPDGAAAKVVVCADVSGSMRSPVSGYRHGATSTVRCVDVAALVAAAVLRKNRDALVLPFENQVVETLELNPRDAIMTNAKKLAGVGGGGTNCSAPLHWINQRKQHVDLVFFVSDNESWVDAQRGRGTKTMEAWNAIKARCPNAKLVCLDIQPYTHTQAAEREDILNVGGFSDQVFQIVSAFAQGELRGETLVDTIGHIVIETPPRASRESDQ